MKLLPLALIALFCFPAVSCRKHGPTGTTDLLGTFTAKTIKINQAVIIYDSTALNDSLLYADPPVTKLYKWLIVPGDGTYEFSDDYQHGRADIIFHRSGDYLVSANIYDSSGQHYTGHTNSMEISVTSDTLYPALPIDKDDQLVVRWNGFGYNPDSCFCNFVIYLLASTTDSYDCSYWQLQYTSVSSNGYSYVISDSVYLPSYPFEWGWESTPGPAGVQLSLAGYAPGMAEYLSFTWLGQTYTGTVTITNTTLGPQLVFNWDNSGAVKLKE
jgi:hypothetical protein